MALSGSAYTSFHRHRLIIEWSASQSIPNNNSTVTAKVYLQGMDAYSAINAPASNAGSVTVNGTTKNFTASSNLSAYQKKLLTTETFTVGHNSDGTKSFNFSTTFNINATLSGVFHGNKTASGSATLNTIPRTSGVSVSASAVNLGSAVTINISRASSSFTHTLSYRNGNYSVTIASKTSSTSVSYTPVVGIASQFPTSTSKSGTITCDTYSGSTKIGSSSVSLTVRTVNNSTFTPTINSVTISEAESAVTTAFGAVYLQNRSRLKVATSTSQKYGASLSSCIVTIDGSNYNGTNITSGSINKSGTITVSVKITDSRGYTATTSQSVTLIAYANPTITSFTASRREDSQANVDIAWTGKTSTVNTANTMGYKLEWKLATASTWTLLLSGSNTTTTTWTGTRTQTGTDIAKAYDVRLTVYDKLSQVVSEVKVTTATVPMSWGTTGVGIGKVFEEGKEVFQVRGDGKYEGRLTTAPDVYASQGGALNLDNSDIVGVNGIWIGAPRDKPDPSDNDGEGLLFPKSNTIIPANGVIADRSGWDNFRIKDGIGYLNGVPVLMDTTQILWSGQSYPVANSNITPSVKLTDCPNGWVLIWSDYDSDTGKANDSDWHFTIIHKTFNSGGGIRYHIPNHDADYGNKYFYCTGTAINGHTVNSATGVSKDVVLRQVVAF